MPESTVLSTNQSYYRIEYDGQTLRSYVLPLTCDFINHFDTLSSDQTELAIDHILRDYPDATRIDSAQMEAERERRRQEYQLLTHEEVLSLVTLYERIQNWRTVKQWIECYYGKNVRFVSINIEPEEPGDDFPSYDDVPVYYEVKDEQQQPCLPLDHDDQENIRWEIGIQEDMPEERAVYDLKNPPSVQNLDPLIYTLIVEENIHIRCWEETITSYAQAYQEQVWLQQVQTTIHKYFGDRAYSVSVKTQAYPQEEYRIRRVLVTDRDNHVLGFDITLPWYTGWMDQQEEEFETLLNASLPVRAATYILPELPIFPDLPPLYRRSDAPFLPELSEHPDVL